MIQTQAPLSFDKEFSSKQDTEVLYCSYTSCTAKVSCFEVGDDKNQMVRSIFFSSRILQSLLFSLRKKKYSVLGTGSKHFGFSPFSDQNSQLEWISAFSFRRMRWCWQVEEFLSICSSETKIRNLATPKRSVCPTWYIQNLYIHNFWEDEASLNIQTVCL